MKKLLLIPTILICAAMSYAQEVTPNPQPKVCISQEAANVAASNAVEVVQLRKLVEELKAGRGEDAKIIEDLKIRLAQETQKAIDLNSEKLTYLEVIKVLTANYKSRSKFGIINF